MTATPSRTSEHLRSRAPLSNTATSSSSRRTTANLRGSSPPLISRTHNTGRGHTSNSNISSDYSSFECIPGPITQTINNNNSTTTNTGNTEPNNNEIVDDNSLSSPQLNDDDNAVPTAMDFRNLQATIERLRTQIQTFSDRWNTAIEQVLDLQNDNHQL